jgi:serine/threonine protein kinase
MAPEIWRNQIYDGHKVDVFALGVLLHILVVGKMPFMKATLDDKHYRPLA